MTILAELPIYEAAELRHISMDVPVLEIQLLQHTPSTQSTLLLETSQSIQLITMYLFRDGSIVLALCSTLSAAVPIAQSNPREFSSEQLDRTNNNRRVKYAQANDGGPNLISPEGGLVLAGTGLGAHLWTKAAANKRHKIQTEQLKLDHQKQTELVEQEMQAKGDRRVEWARKSTAQQHCYGPEVCCTLASTCSLHQRGSNACSLTHDRWISRRKP